MATSFNINEFISNFVGDGYRPNLYEVFITSPIMNGLEWNLKARSASVPQSSIGSAKVPYFGRNTKVAGNRRFDNWDVTFFMDENDFQMTGVRGSLQKWMNSMNMHVNNRRDGVVAPLSYMGTIIVQLYSKDGNPLYLYTLQNCFPVSISPIQLDWGANDRVAEFSATFAYQWFENATTAAAEV